jgi:hypothetical protein
LRQDSVNSSQVSRRDDDTASGAEADADEAGGSIEQAGILLVELHE